MKLVGIQFLKSNVILPRHEFWSFLSACGKHCWNKAEYNFSKILSLGKDYSSKWTTEFLASGNHYFWIFQRFLPVTDFFSSNGKVFFNKILHSGMVTKKKILLVETDFLARGNRFLLLKRFSSCWKPSLKLVAANCKSIF